MASKIIGLDRLNRKLSGLPIKARQRIREAMQASADEIVALMKNLAPTDSGELRNSIGWTWGKAPKGALTVGKVRSTGSENTITIYAGDEKAFYSRWVEFGTVAHAQGGKFTGTEHPGTSAQPFFFPAYRALRRRTKSKITRSINKAAKEVAAQR